ncbi:hypothetical protein LguiB_024560 [Lonicera macranthoides]
MYIELCDLLLLYMEKLPRVVSQTASTTRALKFLFLFSCFCLLNTCVHSQERIITHHISSSSELPPPPSPYSTPAPKQLQLKDRLQKIMLSILFGVTAGLILALLFGCLVRCFLHFINRTPILKGPVVFSPKIAPKTLQAALTNENQLLGSSPTGSYYRTVLDNGLIIAVKRLEPFENGSPETEAQRRSSLKRLIHQDLEILASLRHRNLMSLRAYVRESDRFSLVYDYVPTGSLQDTMNRVRENQLQLSWDMRLRIAVGIVKGLQYLHFTCIPRILHYNLKPSNVMLDAEFEPRLADCGLAKLIPNFDRGAAAAGYNAPECFQNCSSNSCNCINNARDLRWEIRSPVKPACQRAINVYVKIVGYTDKSDVFGFGVILGVLLTGRDPMDPFFGEGASGGSLGGWLQHLQEAGEAREALDKSILGEELEEDEMLMAVRIAVVCLSDLPADRPSSDELVSMLTQLHSF